MISIENVSRTFNFRKSAFGDLQNVQSLNNISLKIENGEIVALLGLNGSGKSTLFKCLTGIIHPTLGKIVIDGMNPYRDRKKLVLNMGAMFGQKTSFIEDLSVRDNLMVFGALYNIPDTGYQERIEYLNKYLNFLDFVEKPFRKLSFGQRVKCELVSILLHNPEYIFVDEPTVGLDIITKEELFNLLKAFNQRYNSTILFSTHELDNIDNFCNRIILMDKGSIILDDTPGNIKSRIKIAKRIRISYRSIIDKKGYEKLTGELPASFIDKRVLEFTINEESIDENFYTSLFRVFEVNNIETSNTSLLEAIKNVYV